MSAKRKTQNRKKATAPKPQASPKDEVERPYDRIAKRVIAAVEEINAALKEAHECADMRVFLSSSGDLPAKFQYNIYQLTHSVFDVVVQYREAEPAWKQVKDPAFKEAAGKGLTFSYEKPAQ